MKPSAASASFKSSSKFFRHFKLRKMYADDTHDFPGFQKFCSFSDFKLHKNICERNKHALATNSDQIDPEGQSSSVKNETQRENLFSVHFVIASSNLMKN